MYEATADSVAVAVAEDAAAPETEAKKTVSEQTQLSNEPPALAAAVEAAWEAAVVAAIID